MNSTDAYKRPSHTFPAPGGAAGAGSGEEALVPRTRWLALWVVAGACLFLMLALFVGQHPVWGVDLAITRALQGFRTPWLDALMGFVGLPHFFPQVILLNVLVILILFFCRLKWEALTLVLIGPCVGVGSTLLRYVIDRPRPSPDLVWAAQAIEKGHYSFPSGHATGVMAIFGFIAFIAFARLRPSTRRTLWVLVYAGYIALVGISRVYVGEHWATDVLGGYLAGSVMLAVMILFYRWGGQHLYPALAKHIPLLENG